MTSFITQYLLWIIVVILAIPLFVLFWLLFVSSPKINPQDLLPHEKLLISSLGHLEIFNPQKMLQLYSNVGLFLTDKRIICEAHFQKILEIPLESILAIDRKGKPFLSILEIKYEEGNKEKTVQIQHGSVFEIQKWQRTLRKILELA